MDAAQSLLDATGTVPIGDARSVAGAADRILRQCFGAAGFDRELLHESFAAVERLFAGEQPAYLACDMPYHDLRHSLDTALVMARLVAGYQRENGSGSEALTAEQGLLGVLLALLHDSGFIRKTSEAGLCGPQLMSDHESRGVEFARGYLQTTALAAHAALAEMIRATDQGADLGQLFATHEGAASVLGRMLGSADLLSQMSDRCYPERCCYHLYPELVLAGRDRARTAEGTEEILFRDGFDLVIKTPLFYEKVVCPRLRDDFRQTSRYLAVHFDGADPYAAAVETNLRVFGRIASDGGFGLLQCEPVTTTRNLAPIYHARPARPSRAH